MQNEECKNVEGGTAEKQQENKDTVEKRHMDESEKEEIDGQLRSEEADG